MGLPAEIGGWLAPGDARHASKDWPELSLHFVGSADSPAFFAGYGMLEKEFGERNELETRDVLRARLAGVRLSPSGSHRLHYRMCLVTGRDGDLAAVRDHTVIVPTDASDRGVVVHLSHLLIAPAWRRSGLAAWLRAIPAWDAAATEPMGDRFIDLVAEMEPPDPSCEASAVRLAAYGKAGFLRPDLGGGVTYLQPDFRPAETIDASGISDPLALILVVRRIGREGERSMPGGELRRLLHAIYAMYGTEIREQDMRPCMQSLEFYPGDSASVPLGYPA